MLGKAYVTGGTSAGAACPGCTTASFNFPTTPGAFQPRPTEPVNCAVYPAGYIPFTQITSYAFGSFSSGISYGYLVVGEWRPAAVPKAFGTPLPNSPNGEGFCSLAELAPNQYYPAYVPTIAMVVEGDFSSFSGTIINPYPGQPFSPNNVISPMYLGYVFAWPVGAPIYTEAWVAKIGNTSQAQVGNLQSTVKNLVSAGTLGPTMGEFLLGPLDAAMAALGDPGHATNALRAEDRSPTRAAIRDLEIFIERVQLLVIFRRLRAAEGRILIDAANSLIAALRV